MTGLAIIVKDDKGNSMSGQPLTVSVAGGGAESGAPNTTIAGSTALGVWTLANKVGANTLTISSGTLTPVIVTVQGTAGPAAKIASNVSLGVSTVGATVTTGFLVSDQFDNPAPAASVQLATTGGGSISSATVTSDASGLIAPAWTMGTARGTNTLTASIGSVSAVLTVVAQSDVPSAIQVTQGGGQSANAGTALLVPPSVTVVDRFANGVPRRAVSFAVTAGGGSVTGATSATTDTNGVAAGPTWVLGKRNIAQQLTATTGSVSQAISAKVNAISIVLRFFGTMTDAQKAVFQGAADRVSAMITKGVGPVQADSFPIAEACGVTGAAPITELIDGVIIYASIGPIDGSGGILAEAGPCGIRTVQEKYQPAIALMLFDVTDLDALAGGGSLEDVATHEMMHTLGFGTLWSSIPLTTGAGGADPRYFGGNGITGCRNIGGAATCATTVPVENTGGSGTNGQHWRESVFSNELMTGYLNGGANPLSSMSITSMVDFGYTVNVAVTDAFSIASAIRAAPGLRLLPDNWERVRIMPQASASLERVGNLLRVRIKP